MSSVPGEDTTIPLTLTERAAIHAAQKTTSKDLEKLVTWAALAELILLERISTYDTNTSEGGFKRRPSGPKSYGLFVLSKKNTGDDILDDLLLQIVKCGSIDKKPMSEVMKDVGCTRTAAKVFERMEQKNFVRIKKGVFSTKYELIDDSWVGTTRTEAKQAFAIVDERGRDESKVLTPQTYALISLIACTGGNIKRDLLEDRDITEATMELLNQIEQRQGGLITVMLFERVYHMLNEYQK
jgi:hypothetical protein